MWGGARRRLWTPFALAGASALIASHAAALTLEPLGTYATGVFDEAAAEISAYDPVTRRLFVVNGADNTVDILDITDPAAPAKVGTLDIAEFGAAPNSVAVSTEGVVAIAVQAESRQDNGVVVFYMADGLFVGTADVGPLPDMVTFTPDGRTALVANEGEPSDDYSSDPPGSVSLIDIEFLTVTTVDFTEIFPGDLDFSVHLPGPPDTEIIDNLEPEYIAVTPDGATALVSLQENNAIAVIDIENAALVGVFGLGYQDFTQITADMSDQDGGINLANWPVFGLFQPDAIAVFEQDGALHVVTANEGDARDYEGYSEEVRLGDLTLDPETFPNAAELQAEDRLGRLKVTSALGDYDLDGDHDEIVAFGARSFSIYEVDKRGPFGRQVFDSGDAIASRTADLFPTWFNSEGTEASFDSRSDDKGSEPEGLALGVIDGRRYAFIGLERLSVIVVYDITDPRRSAWVGAFHNLDPTGDPAEGTAGDIAPEGLLFIPGDDSPTGEPLLVVANEVSGTTTIWAIRR